MLDGLPDTFLLELIEKVPQLILVNKRLFGLSELCTHQRLLSYLDYNDEWLEELTADIQLSLPSHSWKVVEDIARKDYCFFGPEHLVENDACSKCAKGPQECPNQSNDYHVVRGAPWGLYILRWATQCLEYTTFLRAGSYDLHLDVCASQLRPLNGSRVTVVNSPRVTQHFRDSPSLYSLEKQWNFMKPKRLASPSLCRHADGSEMIIGGGREALEFESTRLRVGTLRVDAGQNSDWAKVTVRIESVDWAGPFVGLVLNFLCFEPRPAGLDIATDWTLQPKKSMGVALHALPSIYKRANDRKRQWFEEGGYAKPPTYDQGSCPDPDAAEYTPLAFRAMLPLAT